jgi:hypothetical protein
MPNARESFRLEASKEAFIVSLWQVTSLTDYTLDRHAPQVVVITRGLTKL